MIKKKVLIPIVIIVICMIALLVVITILVFQKQNKYNKLLELGDKYLKEMNYENAILTYSDAINIIPKQEHAYIHLSNVYVENRDYSNAKKILNDFASQEGITQVSEAILQQVSYVEEQETHYKENNGIERYIIEDEDDNDIIGIAQQVLRLEYSGNCEINWAFEKVADTVKISSINKNSILTVVKKDFDMDGQDEILVIVREVQTFSIHMLEKEVTGWQDKAQLAVEEYDDGNRLTVPRKIDFYLKESETAINIYFESNECAHYFSDGDSWLLCGYGYSNGSFERLFDSLSMEGSAVWGFWDLNPEEGGSADEKQMIQQFVDEVRDTGLDINKISIDAMTMDWNTDVTKLFRIELSSELDNRIVSEWKNNSTSMRLEGILEVDTDYVNNAERENKDADENLYLTFLADSEFDSSYYKILSINEHNHKFLLITEEENVATNPSNPDYTNGSYEADIYGIVDGAVRFLEKVHCREYKMLSYEDNKLIITGGKDTGMYQIENNQLKFLGVGGHDAPIIFFEPCR